MNDEVLGESLSVPRGVALSSGQRAQLALLLKTLDNDRHAPTAVRSPATAVDVHLADSLAALALEMVRDATEIADIGAGAGFPGIALAIALPRARVSLVESQRRKCDFMRRTSAELGLANTSVVCARVEEWAAGRANHDLVVVRALASQPVVLEYAAPLLRPGGAVVDWRGSRDLEEEQRAVSAAEELGLRREQVLGVQPFAASRNRHLHVYSKVSETPDRFPRRVGVAAKRPLGAGDKARPEP